MAHPYSQGMHLCVYAYVYTCVYAYIHIHVPIIRQHANANKYIMVTPASELREVRVRGMLGADCTRYVTVCVCVRAVL